MGCERGWRTGSRAFDRRTPDPLEAHPGIRRGALVRAPLIDGHRSWIARACFAWAGALVRAPLIDGHSLRCGRSGGNSRRTGSRAFDRRTPLAK